MEQVLDYGVLEHENRIFRGRGGVSAEARGGGFRPAFLDTETGTVYPSCFGDGTPAPFHLLDGLPHAIVVERSELGRVMAVKDSVISGFARDGRFFTRDEAAREASRLH
jgi:hypothetical protein